MPLEFGWETGEQLLDDGILDLAKRHYAEIAGDQDKIPLAIDTEDYLRREAAGTFRLFTARRDGELVGYIQWYFCEPARYRTTLYVEEASYWLAPEERRGMAGVMFIKAALAALPRPCKVQMREKESFAGGKVALLLERLGLKPVERVFAAWLED